MTLPADLLHRMNAWCKDRDRMRLVRRQAEGLPDAAVGVRAGAHARVAISITRPP